jgi:hypothetical protein
MVLILQPRRIEVRLKACKKVTYIAAQLIGDTVYFKLPDSHGIGVSYAMGPTFYMQSYSERQN